MVSMEVLQKSTGQWCLCRCADSTLLKEMTLILVGISFQNFKSQVGAMEKSGCDELHGRWNKVENVLQSPCQSDLERNQKIFATDLNIQFMSFRGACIFQGLNLFLPHTLDQECFRRGSAARCSQHRHGGKDRGPVLPTCLPASQDHIQLFPESKPLNSLRHSS